METPYGSLGTNTWPPCLCSQSRSGQHTNSNDHNKREQVPEECPLTEWSVGPPAPDCSEQLTSPVTGTNASPSAPQTRHGPTVPGKRDSGTKSEQNSTPRPPVTARAVTATAVLSPSLQASKRRRDVTRARNAPEVLTPVNRVLSTKRLLGLRLTALPPHPAFESGDGVGWD